MKVTANIATYPPRFSTLQKVIDSLVDQVDNIRVYCNSVKDLKDVQKHFNRDYNGRVRLIMGWDQDFDLTDNGKFYSLDTIKEPEYYLTCDDDIIYPPNYVETIKKAIDHYGCIVGFHGRQLLGMGLDYYKDHKSFHFLGSVTNDEVIDVVGTGVCGFRTDYFHPKELAHSTEKRMSDLIFSLEASKQKKQIGVIKHDAGWLKMINNKETIHSTESAKGTPVQNILADQIYRNNYAND
jgi:hypothetical protein